MSVGDGVKVGIRDGVGDGGTVYVGWGVYVATGVYVGAGVYVAAGVWGSAGCVLTAVSLATCEGVVVQAAKSKGMISTRAR